MHRWDDNKPQTPQTQLPIVPNVTDVEKEYWNGKQDALVYDTEPVRDSHNMLNSGSLYSVLTKLQEQIEVAYRAYFEGANDGLGEATVQLQSAQQLLAEALARLEEVNAYARSVADEVDVRTEAALSYRNGSADSAATSQQYAQEAFESAWRAMQAAAALEGVLPDIANITTIYVEVKSIYENIEDINTNIQLAYTDILKTLEELVQDSKDAATLSESYAHGHTGERTDEDTDNSQYYSALAGNFMERAEIACLKTETYVGFAAPEFIVDEEMNIWVKLAVDANISFQMDDETVLYWKVLPKG